MDERIPVILGSFRKTLRCHVRCQISFVFLANSLWRPSRQCHAKFVSQKPVEA